MMAPQSKSRLTLMEKHAFLVLKWGLFSSKGKDRHHNDGQYNMRINHCAMESCNAGIAYLLLLFWRTNQPLHEIMVSRVGTKARIDLYQIRKIFHTINNNNG